MILSNRRCFFRLVMNFNVLVLWSVRKFALPCGDFFDSLRMILGCALLGMFSPHLCFDSIIFGLILHQNDDRKTP